MENIRKIRFLSRRGLKELDILLTHYIDNHYFDAAPGEKKAIYELLLKEDQEILDFVLLNKPFKNSVLMKLQEKLKAGFYL